MRSCNSRFTADAVELVAAATSNAAIGWQDQDPSEEKDL